MIFADSHTHLYAEEYDLDRKEVIEKAINIGVKYMFLPSIDSSCHDGMKQLKTEFPNNIFLMMGLHPTYVKDNWQEELALVSKELETGKYSAVGEIGIDLYWDKSNLKKQQEAFVHQILLAKKHKLPINIHCREAFEEVFEILEQEKSKELFGIFHCFTGDFSDAQRAIDCNLMLGIGGVSTFKNGKIDQFLHKIPLKHIVLETDSPYLSPNPYRGKRNESTYIINIAEKVALIYNKTIVEIATITTENCLKVYKNI